MNSSRSMVLTLTCALSLLALPALGGEQVIYGGVDLWHTPDDGSTLVFFGKNPIPADFFCNGSRPFTGRVALKGVPLATNPRGAFGNADTIIERLDDAVFDDNGVARTRIQFKALSLVSIDPIETVCGPFNLSVYLTGEQPISEEMTIVREGPGGGYFMARFGGNFRLSFTPAEGIWKNGLDLKLSTTLSGSTHSWAFEPGEGGFQNKSHVVVDTDGDQEPDTSVPGTSNFAAGWLSKADDGGAVPIMELKLSNSCDFEAEHKVSPVRPAEFVPPFPLKAK